MTVSNLSKYTWMSRWIGVATVFVFASAIAEAGDPGTVSAIKSKIEISDAISHPSAGAPVGVVYLTIRNRGDRADRLVEVSTTVAATAELHETVIQGNMAGMKHYPDGFEIPAGGTVKLESGGKHIMLLRLNQPLLAEQVVPLELRFAEAGTISILVPVKPRGPTR